MIHSARQSAIAQAYCARKLFTAVGGLCTALSGVTRHRYPTEFHPHSILPRSTVLVFPWVATGWTTGIRVQTGVRDFSLFRQAPIKTHPVSYTGTRIVPAGINLLDHECHTDGQAWKADRFASQFRPSLSGRRYCELSLLPRYPTVSTSSSLQGVGNFPKLSPVASLV
jgi:hypothetical protein